MNEALPLIQVSQNGKFYVEQKAAEILASISGKIIIVCVAGPYRTGKSFLLNCLIGNQGDGFQVGKTIRACTKGIWLWGKPIKKNGFTYVFLDTEGLGSIEQTQHFDAHLFSFGLLLSSYFILNTQGTISESTLEQLQLVVECTKKIHVEKDDFSLGNNNKKKNSIIG